MKLNLGCGQNKLQGYVNTDREPAVKPDVLMDLEKFPWPFEDDSVDEVVAFHVLEHVGATSEMFVRIMQELYRVCRAGAEVRIAVPHPRGGMLDITASLPPHMLQSWNLLGFDTKRYDPIEDAPEE